MTKHSNLALAMLLLGIGSPGLAPPVSAASEGRLQWLQYRAACEGRADLGDVVHLDLPFTNAKPAGVRLPRFKSRKARFATWQTPMCTRGIRHVAIDKTRGRGPHDRIYVDVDGDGHLDDEKPVKAYRIDSRTTYFGPVKVMFEGDDGPITYHLNFQYEEQRDGKRTLAASSACWYEGRITIGKKTHHCVLLDYNVNGTFNDKALDPAQADRIRIGEKGLEAESRLSGTYASLDGGLHLLEIARDGAYVKFTRGDDVPRGTVVLPASIDVLAAGGEQGLFVLKPVKGRVRLPAGTYHVRSWESRRKDKGGASWILRGTHRGAERTFEVKAGNEQKLDIGEPIITSLDVRKQPKGYQFREQRAGRGGESIELTRNGKRPDPPVMRVKSKDGSHDTKHTFNYG
jgi:hypothetical protein